MENGMDRSSAEDIYRIIKLTPDIDNQNLAIDLRVIGTDYRVT